MGSLNGWSILLIIMLIPVLALSGQTKEKDKHGFFGSILLGCGFASIGTRISLSNQKREKSFADLVPGPLAGRAVSSKAFYPTTGQMPILIFSSWNS